MNLEIDKIVIVITAGREDQIFVHTKLPTTHPIAEPNSNAVIKIATQKGYAVEYVKENFRIEPEILDIRYYTRYYCEGRI
jgi:hypothetical protein